MAGVADKARFYLERAVPQLREFEEKEIFTKDEIRTLVSKRTDFEHLVISPGTTPSDFLSYAEWEQSLEALRGRRCRRLKVRNSSSHAGQARTFAIFERAVARHPGSVPLWRAYLDYAGRVRATKRWRKIATRALRLHPSEDGLWVLAGRRASRNGDMEGARAYFMRGCRFCTRRPVVWVEYARSEMEWLTRMEAKRAKATGKPGDSLGQKRASEAAEGIDEDGNMHFGDDSGDEDGADGELVLPDADAEFDEGKQKVFNEEAVQTLEKNPALDGAIPLAVFDIAQKQPFFDAAAAEAFFDVFAPFTQVSSQPKIVEHVLERMVASHPNHPSTGSCLVRRHLIGVDPRTAEYPRALREALARLKASLEETDDRAGLAAKTIRWIEPVLSMEDLDGSIRTVLEHTKKKLEQEAPQL